MGRCSIVVVSKGRLSVAVETGAALLKGYFAARN